VTGIPHDPLDAVSTHEESQYRGLEIFPLAISASLQRPICTPSRQSHSHITTDGRSVGLPSGAHDHIFVFSLTIAGFLMCGTLSEERTGLLLVLDRAVALGRKSHRTHDHILLSHLRLPPTWRARFPSQITLRPIVSRSVCRGVGLPSGAHDQIFAFCLTIAGFLMCGTLSEERTDL
jgi:hypothetical protein